MTERKTTPYGCYDARYILELIPGIVLIIAATVTRLALPRTPSVRLVTLGLVSLGTAWTVMVTVAAIRRLDELQQRIHLTAIAISFAATGMVAVMTRFLTLAGFTAVPTGMWLWIFMCLVWVAAVFVLGRQYR